MSAAGGSFIYICVTRVREEVRVEEKISSCRHNNSTLNKEEEEEEGRIEADGHSHSRSRSDQKLKGGFSRQHLVSHVASSSLIIQISGAPDCNSFPFPQVPLDDHLALNTDARILHIMKCNACWQDLDDDRSIATTCGHVFCVEDASSILNSEDSTCPVCEQVLSKSQMKAVDVSPTDEWVNMAMAGVAPQFIMKSAFKGIAFWIGQKDVERQLTVSKAMHLRQQLEQMQDKYMQKLKELHAAFQKASKRVQHLETEVENLTKDKTELQQNYTEKSRQKRKLEEMYDSLRSEYEKLRRNTSAQLVQKEHRLLRAPISPTTSFENSMQHTHFDETAPVTPSHPGDFWPGRHRGNSNLRMLDQQGILPSQLHSRGAGVGSLGKRSASSPFKTIAGKASSIFTAPSSKASQSLRNMLFSPINKPQPRPRSPRFA